MTAGEKALVLMGLREAPVKKNREEKAAKVKTPNMPAIFVKPQNKQAWENLLTEEDRAILRELLQVGVYYPEEKKKGKGRLVASRKARKKAISEKDIIKLALSGVSIKSPLPILSHFYFNDGMIMATDLEFGITLNINSGFGELKHTTAPAKILSGFVEHHKGDNEVSVNTDGSRMRINEHSIVTLPGDEFPIFPRMEGDPAFTISAGLLADITKKAGRFAASPEESRAVLTGIYFGKGVAVATDGRRLIKIPVKGMPEDMPPFVVRSFVESTIGKIYRLYGDVKIEVRIGDGQVFFSWKGGELFCRTLEGEYPDYSALIRPDAKTHITVNRKEFEEVLRKVMITAQERINPGMVRLLAKKGILNVSSSTADLGETKVNIPCKFKSEEVYQEIAFNGRYMLDFCSSLDSENITLEIKDSESSIVAQNGGFYAVLMPIRIKEEVYS